MSKLHRDHDLRRRDASFSWDRLWELFDGDRDCMNLAHECIDRHRDQGIAISVKFADGHSEHYDYASPCDLSGRFANWLDNAWASAKGDRVAIVLDPGKAFYVSLFGTIKRGAIAVPLFALFGPEGLALRLNDCQPRLILTQQRAEAAQRAVSWDHCGRCQRRLLGCPPGCQSRLYAGHARHRSRGVSVHLWHDARAAGGRQAYPSVCCDVDDRRPLWRGTAPRRPLFLPIVTGVGAWPLAWHHCPAGARDLHIASYAGKFEARRMFEALEEFQITNMAAAPTVVSPAQKGRGARPLSPPSRAKSLIRASRWTPTHLPISRGHLG